jgi:hypothetical protein
MNQESQGDRRGSRRVGSWNRGNGVPIGLITPNPKLKLLGQVREVMRLKHYSIRPERTYREWS